MPLSSGTFLSLVTQPRNSKVRRAVTLIELMIVLTIMAVMAGLAIPLFEPSSYDQLIAGAEVVQAELAYARGLAVTNSSKYKLTFDLPNNRLKLTHSGTNTSLNTLPRGPMQASPTLTTEQITDFDELPRFGNVVILHGAFQDTSGTVAATNVEYGPLGETTLTSPTFIWLRCGSGSGTQFIVVTVDPITGIASIGSVTGTGP